VYFLKEAGLPVRFRFRWDKWGPYSQELADYVDDLAAEGLVKSTPTPVPFSHEGTSGVQYNYSLTSKGNETVPKLTPSNEEVEKISRIFKLVKEVSWQNLELTLPFTISSSSTARGATRWLFQKDLTILWKYTSQVDSLLKTSE